jgi:cobalt-zinc-cadmium efflux system membrane fusion protein
MKKLTLIALQALFLTACHEAPAPKQEAPAPIVQGQQIRFSPNHPQLTLLSITAATATKSITVELPAKLVRAKTQTPIAKLNRAHL